MSTDKQNIVGQPVPIEAPLSMRDLTAVLIKHYGIHAGHYNILIEFQIGMGAVGPNPESLTPGAMIGVSKIGLIPAKEEGATAVNAALVNPAPSSSAKPKRIAASKKPSKAKA